MYSSNGLLKFDVKVSGLNLHEYRREDDTFIIGPLGVQYALQVENLSDRRAMVVLTAEGLSLVEGQELLHPGMGYILEPHSSPLLIPNWVIRSKGYPPLQFGVLPEGCSQIMDRPANPGVLEAQFFFEQANPVYTRDFIGQAGLMLERDSSIGWGKGGKAPIFVQTQFAREEKPADMIAMQYEEWQVLQKMGLVL